MVQCRSRTYTIRLRGAEICYKGNKTAKIIGKEKAFEKSGTGYVEDNHKHEINDTD